MTCHYATDPRYELVATNYPCPIPGRENCLIDFYYDDRTAWWEDGNVYAIRRDAQPIITTWVQKLDKIKEKKR